APRFPRLEFPGRWAYCRLPWLRIPEPSLRRQSSSPPAPSHSFASKNQFLSTYASYLIVSVSLLIPYVEIILCSEGLSFYDLSHAFRLRWLFDAEIIGFKLWHSTRRSSLRPLVRRCECWQDIRRWYLDPFLTTSRRLTSAATIFKRALKRWM